MRHLTNFNKINESNEFKTDDYDIKMFFIDYIDSNKDCFTINNAIFNGERIIPETTYIKNPLKCRKCKIIKLLISKPDGILYDSSKCLTNLDVLSDLVHDVKRFYVLSKEDINYTIYNDYMGLTIEFILLGPYLNKDETQLDKIDSYLDKINKCIIKKGHKRNKIKGNWLDMNFYKKIDYSPGVFTKLSRIGDGSITLDNVTNDIDRDLVIIRNEAWNDNLKFSLSLGDQQVVLKLIKR